MEFGNFLAIPLNLSYSSTSFLNLWDSNYTYVRMPYASAKSLQSCLTLCDPIDGLPPGSPIPGILQARTPEWVAISFSNAWKWKVKVKLLSRVWLLATSWTAAYQAPRPWDFPGKSAGVGCHCLLWECLIVSDKLLRLLECFFSTSFLLCSSVCIVLWLYL